MATFKFNRDSKIPGVSVRDVWHSLLFIGDKEDLISSGVAKPEWFVQGERDGRGIIRRKELTVDGRDIVTIVPKEGQCRVYIEKTKDEYDADRRSYAEEEDEKGKSRVKNQFEHALGLIAISLNIMNSGKKTWRLQPEKEEQAVGLLRELNRIAHESLINSFEAAARAKQDGNFQSFIRKVINDPRASGNEQ